MMLNKAVKQQRVLLKEIESSSNKQTDYHMIYSWKQELVVQNMDLQTATHFTHANACIKLEGML